MRPILKPKITLLMSLPLLIALLSGSCTANRPPAEPVDRPEPSWYPSIQQELFLDQLQKDTFRFFSETTHPENGMVPDRYPDPPFASIAAIGFGLSSWIIGVERGYVSREHAADITRNTIRFFWEAPQGADPEGMAGYRGFFYHFLDMETGTRYGTTELSTIDSALLVAGMLSSQQYFDRDNVVEQEIRALTDSIYARIDWPWMYSLSEPPLISMGWYPESGHIDHDWRGYDEGMILYLLALAAPENRIPTEAWDIWSETYIWDSFYGYEYVHYSPLFVHQYSHMFIDFREIQDAYMRRKNLDYFENSRRATLAQRAYAMENPQGWIGYGENIWGLTACDGPGYALLSAPYGTEREYLAYSARGASAAYVNDDGTIAPTAAGGSVPFAPQQTIEALHYMYETYGDDIYGEYGFLDSFNFTYPLDAGTGEDIWVNDQYLGIDQGPILIQIENYRSGLIWELLRGNSHLQRGLKQAGFDGGWLSDIPVNEQAYGTLWPLSSRKEAASLGHDGSGARFSPNYHIYQHNGASMKVMPSGAAEETKISVRLDHERLQKWIGHKQLTLMIYLPEESSVPPQDLFLGMADVTGGRWNWVDGTHFEQTTLSDGWNEVTFNLPDTMQELDPDGSYKLFFSFMAYMPPVADGIRLPLHEPFYIDNIQVR